MPSNREIGAVLEKGALRLTLAVQPKLLPSTLVYLELTRIPLLSHPRQCRGTSPRPPLRSSIFQVTF